MGKVGEVVRLHRITNDSDESLTLDEAMDEIRRQAGTRFDPNVVKALMRVALHENELAAK